MNQISLKYGIKDISVIIATYNRPDDLEIALNSFKKKLKELKEVIIIDQSTDTRSLNVVKKFKSNKIKYFHSKKPSLTLARNYGINVLSKDSKIALFLDDDITLKKDYFEKLIEVFNSYKNVLGVGGHYFPLKKENSLVNYARRLLLIENRMKNYAGVNSVYGAGYPTTLDKIMKSGWIPGFNMAFKKEILEKEKFDENFFKYGLGEDFEFTTRLKKKYSGNFYITPYAKLIHRVSEVERMPKPKLAYMNHINHFYIQAKNFNDFKGIVSWFIVIMNMSIFQIAKSIINPNKINLAKTKLYFKSLGYSIRKISSIRRGILKLPDNLK